MADEDAEPVGMSLVYPFVVCTSKGGPYEDQSFVAGVQFGRLEQKLAIAAQLGAEVVRPGFPVCTELVPQLVLAAMHHGFPVVETTEVEATDEYDAMPEWTWVVFRTSRDEDHA